MKLITIQLPIHDIEALDVHLQLRLKYYEDLLDKEFDDDSLNTGHVLHITQMIKHYVKVLVQLRNDYKDASGHIKDEYLE